MPGAPIQPKESPLPSPQPDIDDVIAYGKLCASILGEIPAFDCRSGNEIILTQNGRPIPAATMTRNQRCDNPAYLGLGDDGQCVPGSRLGRLKTTNPNVEVVFICRRYMMFDRAASGAEILRPASAPVHEDVAIIAHDRVTGAPCWHQALPPGSEIVPIPSWRVPPPHEAELPDAVAAVNATKPPGERALAARDFWLKPSDTRNFQCASCHDSDPWLYSPHLENVRELLPTSARGQKYWMVSRLQNPPHWRAPLAIAPRSPDAQNCVSCHRIGDEETCATLAPDSVGRLSHMAEARTAWSTLFPETPWMPNRGGNSTLAKWQSEHKKHADALLSCCQQHARLPADAAVFAANCTASPITLRPPVDHYLTALLPKDRVSTVRLRLTTTSAGWSSVRGESRSLRFTLSNTAAHTDLRQVRAATLSMGIEHQDLRQLRVTLEKEIVGTFTDDPRLPKTFAWPGTVIFDGSSGGSERRTVVLNSDSPGSPLAHLIGLPLAGAWRISVTDSGSGLSGRLSDVELKLDVVE